MIKSYLNEIKNYKVLSSEESVELLKKGGKKNYTKVLHGNLRLVVKITKKITNTLELDVINTGNIALYNKMKNFDYNKNVKFSTYAYYIIRSAILRYIQTEKRRGFRVPSKYIESKPKENMSKKTLQSYKAAEESKNIVSIENYQQHFNDMKDNYEIPDFRYNVEKEVDKKLFYDCINNVSKNLDKINKTILQFNLTGIDKSSTIIKYIAENNLYQTYDYNKQVYVTKNLSRQTISNRIITIKEYLKKIFQEKYNLYTAEELL